MSRNQYFDKVLVANRFTVRYAKTVSEANKNENATGASLSLLS